MDRKAAVRLVDRLSSMDLPDEDPDLKLDGPDSLLAHLVECSDARGRYFANPKMIARMFWWATVFAPRPPIPTEIRRMVYSRDGHRCLHCGTTEALSLDHIYPYSLGGSDEPENLQTLCRPCNSSKGAKV